MFFQGLISTPLPFIGLIIVFLIGLVPCVIINLGTAPAELPPQALNTKHISIEKLVIEQIASEKQQAESYHYQHWKNDFTPEKTDNQTPCLLSGIPVYLADYKSPTFILETSFSLFSRPPPALL